MSYRGNGPMGVVILVGSNRRGSCPGAGLEHIKLFKLQIFTGILYRLIIIHLLTVFTMLLESLENIHMSTPIPKLTVALQNICK